MVSAPGLWPVAEIGAEGALDLLQILKSLPLLWAVLAIPGTWIIWGYATGSLAYGEFIHASGDWSAWLLVAALGVTPLRRLVRGSLVLWLAKRRRDLGVASFAYATGHLAVYLLRKVDLALIVQEGIEPGLLTGWVAFVIFVPLAVTSNNASVQLLRSGWKQLHRFVYPAAILVASHWVLVAFDPTLAIACATVITLLLLTRLVPAKRHS